MRRRNPESASEVAAVVARMRKRARSTLAAMRELEADVAILRRAMKNVERETQKRVDALDVELAKLDEQLSKLDENDPKIAAIERKIAALEEQRDRLDHSDGIGSVLGGLELEGAPDGFDDTDDEWIGGDAFGAVEALDEPFTGLLKAIKALGKSSP